MNDDLKLGFSGSYCDAVTGGYPLGNGYRLYLPHLMRFNAPDDWSPFGPGGINPYSYCDDDPINDLDLSGHMPTAFERQEPDFESLSVHAVNGEQPKGILSNKASIMRQRAWTYPIPDLDHGYQLPEPLGTKTDSNEELWPIRKTEVIFLITGPTHANVKSAAYRHGVAYPGKIFKIDDRRAAKMYDPAIYDKYLNNVASWQEEAQSDYIFLRDVVAKNSNYRNLKYAVDQAEYSIKETKRALKIAQYEMERLPAAPREKQIRTFNHLKREYDKLSRLLPRGIEWRWYMFKKRFF